MGEAQTEKQADQDRIRIQDDNKNYKKYIYISFLLTFCLFSVLEAARKHFSITDDEFKDYVKKPLKNENGKLRTQQGQIDSADGTRNSGDGTTNGGG